MLVKIVLSLGMIVFCFLVIFLLVDVLVEDYWVVIVVVVEVLGVIINLQVSVDGNVMIYGNILLQYELLMDVGSFGFYVGLMYVIENCNGMLFVMYLDIIFL